MMKPIVFPDLANLSELFTLTPIELPKPSSERMIAYTFDTVEHGYSKRTGKPWKKKAPCWLSGFVSLRDCRPGGKPCGTYFRLAPTPKLLNYIAQGMLLIEYDTIHIELIVRDDGSMLVTVSYGKIIGSHWLTIMPVERLAEAIRTAVA
jgi:hypothetical protein